MSETRDLFADIPAPPFSGPEDAELVKARGFKRPPGRRTRGQLKRLFLRELARRGTIKAACEAVPISREKIRRWLSEDRRFAELYDLAMEGVWDDCEQTLLDVARNGKSEDARIRAALAVLEAYRRQYRRKPAVVVERKEIRHELVLAILGNPAARAALESAGAVLPGDDGDAVDDGGHADRRAVPGRAAPRLPLEADRGGGSGGGGAVHRDDAAPAREE